MRRIAGALLVLALIAGGMALASRGAAAPQKAALEVVTEQPLVIQGFGFKRLEVVRVTATAGPDRATRRLTARRSGVFTARFAGVTYDPCTELLVVRALGSKGSKALLRLFVRECPNP